MVASSITLWDKTTPGNNDDADGGINWLEGQLPGTVNGSARAMMERLAEYYFDMGAANTVAGTANAITVTLNDGATAYVSGQHFSFIVAATNTSQTVGITVNGISSKSIKIINAKGTSVNPAIGALPAGWRCQCVYDGTNVILLNPAPTVTAEARPNLFWNGNHVISQQNGTTLGTTTGYFAADNMAMYFTAATAAMSVQQVATTSLNGSKYQVEYKCTTAKASLGASDYVALTGKIEGFDCQALKWGSASAVPATLSFNYTGPAGLRHAHIQNAAGNRHIAVPFTPAQANTEERISLPVPADTGGTWTYDATGMVTIDFIEAAGTTLTGGTASTWGATTYYAAATQKNALDSIANVVRITDIQFSADPDSTGVAPAYEMPDYAETLLKSKRYYQKSFAADTAPAQNVGLTNAIYVVQSGGASTSQGLVFVSYQSEMRAAPTVTIYNPSAANAQARGLGSGTDWSSTAVSLNGTKGHTLSGTSPAGTAAGQFAAYHYSASARM